MSLNITQYNQKWRIEIVETLEFETFQEMQETLSSLLAYKQEYGELVKTYQNTRMRKGIQVIQDGDEEKQSV